MKKIEFSVLMSVYKNDTPENVKVAIDSILNQTLQPNQFVIMVDGKIPSKLEKMLDEVCEKNSIIELHKRDKNLGLGLTLNEGIKYCKYDYIARMDSDDISLPNRFEKQIEFIRNNPSYDVIGGNIVEFDDLTNKDISNRNVPEKHDDIVKYSKKRNPVNHVSVVFLKSSVLSAGSYQDCMYFEDYYLWMRMIKSGFKFYNVQENLVRVRAGLNFSSRRGSLKYIKYIINFENKIFGLGLITIPTYIYNVFVRCIVSLMPNKLRYYLYQKKLRS